MEKTSWFRRLDPSRERRSLLMAVLVAAGTVFYLYYGLYKVLAGINTAYADDFEYSYLAARSFLSGASVYNMTGQEVWLYIYAPVVTLPFLPFAWLGELQARQAWFLVCHALAAWSFFSMYRYGRNRGRLPSLAAASAALLFSMPLYATIYKGNLNILIFAGLVWAYGSVLSGGRRLLPELLAAFSAVKLSPAVMAAFFLRRGRGWDMLRFVLALAALALLSVVVFGVADNLEFIGNLRKFAASTSVWHAISLPYALRLAFPSLPAGLQLAAAAAALCALGWTWWKVSSGPAAVNSPRGAAAADLFALTLIVLLVSPSSWPPYALFLAPAFYFIILSDLEGAAGFRLSWLFWAAFLLLSGWEIIYNQLPLYRGMTLLEARSGGAMGAPLMRLYFSLLFMSVLALFCWLMVNYGAFAASAERAAGGRAERPEEES